MSEWLKSIIPMTVYAGQYAEKDEHSSTAGGVQLEQPLWKSVWRVLKKMGMCLPKYPSIPLLYVYPNEAHSCNKDICSTMFMAAPFVIAKNTAQPRKAVLLLMHNTLPFVGSHSPNMVPGWMSDRPSSAVNKPYLEVLSGSCLPPIGVTYLGSSGGMS